MQIEKLSIKAFTTSIFVMVLVASSILSLFAGIYFRQAAIDEQMNSLSRVIEVATDEMLKELRKHTFNLGMRLGNSKELLSLLNGQNHIDNASITKLLDDPFINGFVGFSHINLEKIRIFDLDLNLIAESSKGLNEIESGLDSYLADQLANRHGIERLQAVNTLWLSKHGPLHSTVTPLGGLRLIGYLEIIIDPTMNLPEMENITKTPISVFSSLGMKLSSSNQEITNDHLPVRYTIRTSDGKPAFRVVGYENVSKLNSAMLRTQIITTSGFLLLTITILLAALWMFNKFLLHPLSHMIGAMDATADGNLNLTVSEKGVREFHVLAKTFNSMASQIQAQTNELKISQNRLLHILDLDDSVILCTGEDNEIAYFNKSAPDFFGYTEDEMKELYLSDLFTNDIPQLMADITQPSDPAKKTLYIQLNCIGKKGTSFQSNAVINTLGVIPNSGQGYAIVLNPNQNRSDSTSLPQASMTIELSEQRVSAVEQSLNRILEIAKNHPGLLLGPGAADPEPPEGSASGNEKAILRTQAVNVMRLALTCWEHDLGKSKLELAEESMIWPVYIDKSTPTTRTLDKYLHIEHCPKNPRCQRVIDTAEFVLRQMRNRTTPNQQRLVDAVRELRLSISRV